MEKVIIVDENDIPIGFAERHAWADGEIHRATSIWLTNSKGEILIAQRALEKKHAGGKWAGAAAGTVEEGETYETNILKETEEELGISLSAEQLTRGPKILIGKEDNRRFVQWFLATVDTPLESLRLQPEEVMDARWISYDALKQWSAEHPDEFVKTIRDMLEMFPTLSLSP